MKTIFSLIIAVFLIGAAAITEISSTEKTKTFETEKIVRTSPDADMAGWSDASKLAVMMMKEKYGEPKSATSEMMMWENTGQWKRTVVYAKEYDHDFPLAHTDVMQQWIDYEVPFEKLDELAEFDGSVVVNRTNGVISARCDLEGANLLAINLAHDVIEGTKDVKSARDSYAKTIKEMVNGEKPAYMQKLQFDVASRNTTFTDEPHSILTEDDIMKMEKMKENMMKEYMPKKDMSKKKD